LRVYGRTRDVLTGKKTWVVVTTDANGFNDEVYLTNLAQVLKLNLGESPFWADWGIPARQSVITQIDPDFYMALIQQRFALNFMSLTLQRMQDATDETGRPSPYYQISVITHWGAYLPLTVPI
jgi:hypothetical protein